jgi:hypothetical protein
VGIHVVGSAAGHPEMIWATFEHFANTLGARYTYNSNSGVKTEAQNTVGTWLFAAGDGPAPFNSAYMKFCVNASSSAPCTSGDIGDILAFLGHTINPSATLRSKPWVAASDISPNPIDGSATASKTETISINKSISGMMTNGGVRNNDFMTDAT